MGGIAIAVLGILGSITVALVTWLLSLISDVQKSIIQKEQTKFASFHAKQVEVLSSLYKLLSPCLRHTEFLYKKIKKPFQDEDDATTFHKEMQDSMEFEKQNELRVLYKSVTRQQVSDLTKSIDKFKMFVEDNEIYLDNDIVHLSNRIHTRFSEIIKEDKYYVTDSFDSTYDAGLQKSFAQSIADINLAKANFKNRAKAIMGAPNML